MHEAGMLLRLQAMALEMPRVLDHPNRMPFSGILTRLDRSSDKAPHGTNGKNIVMTRGAAERAIPSLLGMGVNLTADLNGHDPKAKVGLITSAHIDGDALRIDGFVYAADFPAEALRIHMTQSDLGFSFEAQKLRVESLDADPLVILDCFFTGASILMKDSAAYHTTAIAAAAAQSKELQDKMDAELKAALTEIVQAGIAPVAAAQAATAERLTAMEASVATITERVEAHAAIVSKVEPVAKGLEVQAAAMEAIGATAASRDFLAMASRMREDAARGIMPTAVHASQPQQHQPAEYAPRFEDSAAFKALEAKLAEQAATRTTTERAALDEAASLKTQIADLKAAALAEQSARGSPQRKTFSPQIAGILAKAGIGPDVSDPKMSVAEMDKALEGLPVNQRMIVKTGMLRQGLVSDGIVAPR